MLFFCGNVAELGKTKGPSVWAVRTLDFKDSVFKACAERNDEWAEKVKRRLECVSDLPAADAIYHQICSANFRTKRKLPQSFTSEHGQKRSKPGRPVDKEKADAFLKVAEFLKDNDTEQLTINDLIDQMKQHTGGDAYSFSKMKSELQKHFGEELIIKEIGGLSSVATLRKTASSILHGFYAMPIPDSERDQKERTIKAAADLIKSDIKTLEMSPKQYPSPDDVAST